MSYTAPGIDNAGLHVPEYEDIKQELLDRFRQIFGADLYLGEDTQDYQMIAEFSDCLDDVYSLIIDSYNNRNPNFATGTALDMIIALNGLRRIVATKSTVVLTLGGTEGAYIPAGSIVQDIAGYQWETTADATIPASGTVDVNATCTVAGAINAAVGSITQIMDPTAGWVSVINNAVAVAGQNTESDSQLHDRREKSVANAGVSIAESIYGSVRALTGVSKVRLYQNNTGSTDSNGIPGHSICLCVLDGEDADIAKAIFNKKSPGCGTYGNTAVTVVDVFGNNNIVNFERADKVDVSVSITLKTFAGYNDGTAPIIKQNIVDYIQSLNIGDDLNIGLLWSPILAVNTDPNNPVCSPLTVTVTPSGGTAQSSVVDMQFNQYPSCEVSDITITVSNS